jgi:hypothetical protein
MEPVDPTVNVNVVLAAAIVAAASVDPADTTIKLPYLAHFQSDIARSTHHRKKWRRTVPAS